MSREFGVKLEQLRERIKKKRKGAALITRQPSFSWLACGGEARVALNTDKASAAWLVTPDEVYLLANNVEMPRLKSEGLPRLKYKAVEFPWHEPDGLADSVKEIIDPKRLLSDSDDLVSRPQPQVFAELRYSLCPEEVKRFRQLGKALEAAVSITATRIRVGESEDDIAAQMAAAALAVGITPVVMLVAVDDRIKRFRHPLPAGKRLKRHAMLIMCARQGGLIASMTRTVYFGDLPEALERRHQAVCAVDVAMQRATAVGVAGKKVLEAAQEQYRRQRFPKEWESHHQGGPCGYLPREYIVTPKTTTKIAPFQPVTWNPTIAGVKSEDTQLVTSDGLELITRSRDWPMVDVVLDKKKTQRYAILER